MPDFNWSVIGKIRFTINDPRSQYHGKFQDHDWVVQNGKFNHTCRESLFKNSILRLECGPLAYDTTYTTVLDGYVESDWVHRTPNDLPHVDCGADNPHASGIKIEENTGGTGEKRPPEEELEPPQKKPKPPSDELVIWVPPEPQPEPEPPQDDDEDMQNINDMLQQPGDGGPVPPPTQPENPFYNTRDGKCRRWTCEEKCQYKKQNPISKSCWYGYKNKYRRRYRSSYKKKRYYPSRYKKSSCGCGCK
jgi:hypothetical protein